MRAPSVLIIASPYEGELMGRALVDTGLRVLRADGGEGAHALLATELPIAVVIGTSLFGADPLVLVADACGRHPRAALYVLADVEDPLVEEMQGRVTAIFRRPADFDMLAHAIERLAVEVERAHLAEGEEVSATARTSIPRIPTLPFGTPPEAEPLVRAHRTEILGEAEGPSLSSGIGPRRNGDRANASLLRADDALSLAGFGIDEVKPAKSPRIDNRSNIAREIDRELSKAERRLFPNDAATARPFAPVDDYDDVLGDIDLDSLAIDTVPGPSQRGSALLGVDETRGRTRAPEAVQRSIEEEGSLADTDIAELIARLHTASFSGALEISSDAWWGEARRDLPDEGGRASPPLIERVLYFDQGEPISARSTLRHDHLAEQLFREGKLTREQASRAREGGGRSVALRLVELGFMKESEVFPAVRRHTEELFYSMFALESGGYRVGPKLPPAEDRVRLPSGGWALVLEGLRRKYGLERLSSRLGGRDAVLHPTPLRPRIVEAAGLTADERRVVALLDGARTLGEIHAALGGRLAEGLIYAIAWGLRVAGALDTGSGETQGLREISTVVTENPGGDRRAHPRAASQQAAAEAAVDRERIAAKGAQILDADYFAILGVGRQASDHELRRAHARLRADFDPARFTEEIATEHRAVLAEIREVLDEALRVLIAPAVRAPYAAHLDDGADA